MARGMPVGNSIAVGRRGVPGLQRKTSPTAIGFDPGRGISWVGRHLLAATRTPTAQALDLPRVRSESSVVDLLLARRAANSRPGQRTDGATIALVIEGGGMRGVVSGGMVTALQQLDLGAAFDAVIGTSAGALAGAYFLAGQAGLGTSIYYEDLTGKDWLSFRRLLRRRPPLALDYLLSHVMVERKPLDSEAVFASEVPLYAVATKWPEREPTVLGSFDSAEALVSALHASARIPLAAGRPVRIDDELFLDGSLSESIPVDAALTLEPKPTHLLALLTRPRGSLRRESSTLSKLAFYPLLNLLLPGLKDANSGRAMRYLSELEHLERLSTPDSKPRALVVQMPSDGPLIRQLEQTPQVLIAGAEAGAAAVHCAISGEPPTFDRGFNIAP